MPDTSILFEPASRLAKGAPPKNATSHYARLAEQFVTRNRSPLGELGVSVSQRYIGSSVDLVFESSFKVGAVPLVSPTTGSPDYGLIVRPRFDWSGIGPMMSQMGWRIIPSPLAMALLPRSDRKIPPWVLSTIVLARIESILSQLTKRFEMISEDRSSPKGTIDWAAYGSSRLARARFLDVPCRFPDLRSDRALRSAIRFTLEKQRRGLEGQRTSGAHVLRLLERCRSLLEQVRDVSPRDPSVKELDAWLRGPLRSPLFKDGIQAIEWTTNDRGLAGLSDLSGLPWVMSMDEFFEAWCETVMSLVSLRIGGTLRTGRQRQTVAPLAWQPSYLGSQKSVVPDLMLERGDLTVIVDAKYKEHWEEMQPRRWGQQEDELRERHRADLLQVLAYANLSTSTRTIAVLAYPCSVATWESLASRRRLFHRAALRAGDRVVEIVLTAFPMGVAAQRVAEPLAEELLRE